MPSAKSVSQIKAALLHPATTSHFEVEIPLPTSLNEKYLNANGIKLSDTSRSNLNLMCCEASLPGSNLATLELNNDHTGVTERHAYRRVYDDRIDLTFYVDARYYLPIKVFESWIKYISQESVTKKEGGPNQKLSSKAPNYFYSFQYPDKYVVEGLTVTKFEKSSLGGVKGQRNLASTLTYTFVRAFPISVSSMPVSYDSSSLLKCTVSMSYVRYLLSSTDPPLGEDNENSEQPLSIEEQAAINSAGPGFTNPELDRRARAVLGIGEFNPNLQRNINGQILSPENAQFDINGNVIDTGDRLITIRDFPSR